MSYQVTPLLDETDTKTRVRQHALLMLGVAASLAGVSLTINGALTDVPRTLITGLVLLLLGIALHFVAARTIQLFETSYKGHRVRFTNNPLTAERLFIDGQQVARGGFGFVMRLEGMIPAGDGAGDKIIATSEARLTHFRCRIEAQAAA
jgi:hypothetical protein